MMNLHQPHRQKNMGIGMPCDLQCVSNGFSNLVKIEKAHWRDRKVKQYGRHQNPKREPNISDEQEKCPHDVIQTLNQRTK